MVRSGWFPRVRIIAGALLTLLRRVVLRHKGRLEPFRNHSWIHERCSQVTDDCHPTQEVEREEVPAAPASQRDSFNELGLQVASPEPVEDTEFVCAEIPIQNEQQCLVNRIFDKRKDLPNALVRHHLNPLSYTCFLINFHLKLLC